MFGPLLEDCAYCIDGNMPAGTPDVLGPVYTPCRVCLPACPSCGGGGVFPANFTCLHCLATALAALGLAPLLCGCCLGVVDLVPLDTVPQVTRHVPHTH